MFATFTSVVLSAREFLPPVRNRPDRLIDLFRKTALMTALQPRFFEIRALYESREEPPKMFHWSIFIITIVVTEILTNIVTGTLFFLPWYVAVGFWQSMTHQASRGAYQWVVFVNYSVPCPSSFLTSSRSCLRCGSRRSVNFSQLWLQMSKQQRSLFQ
jgi:ABC-type multidrug transport system permease subunit